MDKLKMWSRLKFDVMFVGDDWLKTPKWTELEAQLDEKNVKVIYFPYYKGTSSTKINTILEQNRVRE